MTVVISDGIIPCKVFLINDENLMILICHLPDVVGGWVGGWVGG